MFIYLECNIKKEAQLYLFCVNGYKQCTRKCCKVETDWEIPKFVNFSNMFMLSILLSAGLWSMQMEQALLTWYILGLNVTYRRIYTSNATRFVKLHAQLEIFPAYGSFSQSVCLI